MKFHLIASAVASLASGYFSTAEAAAAEKLSGSILMDQPAGKLLAAKHFGLDSTPLGYEALAGKNTIKNKHGEYANDDMYVSLADDVERMKQAKEISTKFANKNRQLVLNGHLSDVLVEGCDAGYVYGEVTYDDAYTPECQCLLDQNTGIIWMECWLGNNECLDINNTPDTPLDDECQGTYEIFFFHEPTGELESKATCSLCHTPNCEAHFTSQICTEVFFDEKHVPNDCNVIRFPNNTVEVCEECTVCGGPNSGTTDDSWGVNHMCFGSSTGAGVCDTDTYAHLHNFEIGPSPYGDRPEVGGLFAQVCSANAIDSVLYGDVGYDTGSSVLCDCDDPASGTIACDIHDAACFANLCTTVSEVFYFNPATGNFQFKWTIDWGQDFLWTETHFNPGTGQALNCSVLSVDPITTELLACSNCQICDSAQDGKGIAYDCFGTTQQGTCDTTNGRAKYNFDVQAPSPTKPPVAPPTPVEGLSPPAPAPGGLPPKPTPPSSPTFTTVNQNNNAAGEGSGSSNDDKNNLGIILGALFGGMAVAFLVVLILRPRNRAADPTVMEPGDGTIDGGDSSVPPSFVISDDGAPSHEEESQGWEGVVPPGSAADAEIPVVSSMVSEGEPVENKSGFLA